MQIEHLYRMQSELNQRYFRLYPDKPKSASTVALALLAELGEFLNELKPNWAWWKNGSVDRLTALEEAADLIFFALTFDLVRNVAPYVKDIQPYQDRNHDPFRQLPLLLSVILGKLLRPADNKPIAHIVVWWLLQFFSEEELLQAYQQKYAVNIKRLEQIEQQPVLL